ncbi:DinB family protein [Peribacillus sp. SCS-37]|uniref:DinB family protein n=1 Tax=Paraperibacillus esterisolvens TaxID=3115296 RepID=UPI003905C062
MNLLVNLLDSTYDKESWYAPFREAIDGLRAEQASWKPPGAAAQTIWENVNHLTYYKERLAAKLEGRDWPNPLDGDQTFSLTPQSNDDGEWEKVIERAENAHQHLREVLSRLSDDELDQDSLERKLLDIMLHDAYHTGQIIQSRKMQGSWPSHR